MINMPNFLVMPQTVSHYITVVHDLMGMLNPIISLEPWDSCMGLMIGTYNREVMVFVQ